MMKNLLSMKIGLMTFLFLFTGISFQTLAQNITLTWEKVPAGNYILIYAPENSSFEIDWGNNTEAQTFTVAEGTDYIYADLRYEDPGTYTVKVTDKNNAMTEVYIYPSTIKTLTCKSTTLGTLNCSENQMTQLDLTGCPALAWLECQNNQLATLDLSKNVDLMYIDCSNNLLTSLNLSENTGLTEVNCKNNKLTNLLLGNDNPVEMLYCDDNELANLDISGSILLTKLDCSSNSLTALDITENEFLDFVSCFNNQLPLKDLYNISEKITAVSKKKLGTQTKPIQTVELNEAVNLSDLIIGGIPSVIAIKKGTENAVENRDYTLSGDQLTFLIVGTYTVEMTNSAIISDTEYPAKYIAEFKAGTVISIETATIAPIPDQPYTGEQITPELTVTVGSNTLRPESDYTVVYADNTDAGTATITITGINNYEGTKTARFTITPLNINTADVGNINNYTYTGQEHKPEPEVKYGQKVLVKDTDYDLSYSNNTNAGTEAEVTITGKDNYTGTKTANFTIEKASQTITFAELGEVELSVTTVTAQATSSSTLALSYASANEDIAIVSTEGVITLKTTGEVEITASQAGNENYLAAEPVIRMLNIVDNSTFLPTIERHDVRIYPNPVSDILYIESEIAVAGLILYDINGKMLQQTSSTSKLDISTQPNGIYFLKIVTSQDEIIREIIKK